MSAAASMTHAVAAVVVSAVLAAQSVQPSRCVVAIDVGHTVRQSGSVSARGVDEHRFNRAMAETLLAALRGRGDSRSFIVDPDAVGGLPGRARAAAQQGADVLVSLHHDSVQPHYLQTWTHEGRERRYSDRFRGHSLFVSSKNAQARESVRLARHIGERLLALGQAPTLHHAERIKGESRPLLDKRLGIYRFDDLLVLKSATIPAVLVECGVIVHRDEEVRLSSASYRVQLADAIADGTAAFCRS